jgi:uncharacterized protein YlxP (DUF503 family)
MKTWFGIGQYLLVLPDCHSLKDKRQRLRSILARLHGDLGASVSEVGLQDQWQRAAIGVAFAASSETGIDRVLDRVVAIIERDARVVVTDRTAIVDALDLQDEGLPPGWDLLED